MVRHHRRTGGRDDHGLTVCYGRTITVSYTILMFLRYSERLFHNANILFFFFIPSLFRFHNVLLEVLCFSTIFLDTVRLLYPLFMFFLLISWSSIPYCSLPQCCSFLACFCSYVPHSVLLFLLVLPFFLVTFDFPFFLLFVIHMHPFLSIPFLLLLLCYPLVPLSLRLLAL